MIRLPDDTASTIALADWLEASLLVMEEEPYRISDADLTGALTDAGLDADGDRENIITEIRRRSIILGDRYPIVREGEGFALREDHAPEHFLPYRFLLLASLNQSYVELVYAPELGVAPARLFEELAGEALRSYVGGSVIRLGASRRAPVPAALPAAVGYAAGQLNEENTYGQLEEQIGGDDGCDLIAWRPFPDAQASQLIVLAQCAMGTGWRDKRSELDLGVWAQHLNWHAKPMKAFAVPFIHEYGNSWRETSIRGGVLFDRVRIAGLVDPAAIPAGMREELEEWSVARRVQVSALTID